ncbi:hypothetical protein JCM8097_002169 [Rhodosporidiobolus ruineniae]
MATQDSFNPLDFDPLYSPTRATGGMADAETVNEAPSDLSFFGHSSSQAAQDASPTLDENETSFLIDIAPPTPSTTKPLRLSSSSSSAKRSSRTLSSSTARHPSPLKFSFFEDSFDESTSPLPGVGEASFAFPSGLHRIAEDEDTENRPFPVQSTMRASGRKWGVMGKMKEEKQKQKERRRSRSLSPVKDWSSPLREGNSSMFISTTHLGSAGDLSLIADEGGSFLAGVGAGDVTLEEEGTGGMSQLLRGLGDSTSAPPSTRPYQPKKRPSYLPSSRSVPALSSNIPSDLVSSTTASPRSTRPPLARSLSSSLAAATAALPPVPPINAETDPSMLEGFSRLDLGSVGASGAAEHTFLGAEQEPSFFGTAGRGEISLFPPASNRRESDPSLLLAEREPSFFAAGTVGRADASSFLPLPPSSVGGNESSLLVGETEPSFFATAGRGGESFLLPPSRPAASSQAGRSKGVMDASFFGANEPSRSLLLPVAAEEPDVTLLNASTASFVFHRDSPVKPRPPVGEAWSESEDEEGLSELGAGGKTPRPPVRVGRVSEGSSQEEDGTSGSDFDLTGWRTAELTGMNLFKQVPPPDALRAESTSTLLIGLQSPLRPTAASIFSAVESASSSTSPRDAERDLLACSVSTVTASPIDTPTPSSPVTAADMLVQSTSLPPSRSSSQLSAASSAVPEGDLLGIGDVAPSPPRHAVEAALPKPSKAESGPDRLKRRLQEIKAQKQKEVVQPAPPAATTPRHRRTSTAPSAVAGTATPGAAPLPFADTRPTTAVKTQKTLKPARSSGNLAGAAGRPSLARPRQSTLPSSGSTKPTTPPRAASSAAAPTAGTRTPGERKASTSAALARLREQRAKQASPEKKPAAAGGATGLQRRSTIAAPRMSVAPSTARAGMAASKSVGEMKPPTRTTGLARPCLAGSSSSNGLARPSSRPSLAPSTSRTSTSTASARPSLARASASSSSSFAPSLLPSSSSSTSLKRSSSTSSAAPKLQFTSMPMPRARVPLKGIQPAASSSSTGAAATSSNAAVGSAKAAPGALRPRASRIGLAKAAAGTK